jgi:hypothetical protein
MNLNPINYYNSIIAPLDQNPASVPDYIYMIVFAVVCFFNKVQDLKINFSEKKKEDNLKDYKMD